MRKYIWKSVFMAFIMTWMGCAQDAVLDVSDTDSALAPGEVLVKLTLSPEVETRAPRPLAWPTITGNRVDKVKLFFYGNGAQLSGLTIKDETGKGLTHNSSGWGGDGTCDGSWILEWNKSSEDRPYQTKDEDTDGIQSVVLRVTGLEEGTIYTIKAYGYSEDFQGEIGGLQNENFTCTYDNNLPKYGIEEVFSGKREFSANSEIIPEVRLTRDVAGFMACFYNVPTNVQKIILKKHHYNSAFYLLTGSDYNGISSESGSGELEYTFTIPEDLAVEGENYKLTEYLFPDDMPKKYQEALSEYLGKIPETDSEDGSTKKYCFFVSFFMIADSDDAGSSSFSSSSSDYTFSLTLKMNSSESGVVESKTLLFFPPDENKIKRNHFYYIGTPYNPIDINKVFFSEDEG